MFEAVEERVLQARLLLDTVIPEDDIMEIDDVLIDLLNVARSAETYMRVSEHDRDAKEELGKALEVLRGS